MVRNCDALIAIIGPQWSNLFQEKLANAEKDYVKLELEIALQERKFIAPICIEGAYMPSDRDIPAELHPILKLNAPSLSSGIHFPDDMKRIIDALESELSSKSNQLTSNYVRGNPIAQPSIIDQVKLLIHDDSQQTVLEDLVNEYVREIYTSFNTEEFYSKRHEII